MKNVLIITSFLIFSLYKSQENIQTDRPDQTESTSITPTNYLQIETGFHYEKRVITPAILHTQQFCGNMVLMNILNCD